MCAPSYDPPEHANHPPGHLYIRAADRLEVLVLRLEADVVALAVVALDRRLGLRFVLGADDRHNDVPVARGRLLAHHDSVAVEDARVLHRFSAHLEDEVTSVPAGKRRDFDVFLDVLVGEDRRTGCNAADEGKTRGHYRALR